ncbi:MAG: dehydrogenase [Bacteroidetes bacterium]|nr:MAG: dehydrogenase [Bacteroidota bacterium]
MLSRLTRLHAVLIALICAVFACQKEEKPQTPPRELTETEKRLPENALAGLEVAEGLELTLFAHEPMLVNPTNIDVDVRGRVWVCEAFNYRNSLNPTNPYKKSGDRILILEDTDGDAKADKSTVFYQGEDVNAALGICVLGNRAIVSCSPNVLVFTDDNEDGVADRKDTLFTGIGGTQHDHAIHAFTAGPDGKLYFNHGNEGKQVLDKKGQPIADAAGRIINASGKPWRQGMVFRCNPDGSSLEVLGSNFRNNYEVAPDAFGTLWQSDNDDDGNRGVRINYVMERGNFGYTDEYTGAGWQAIRTAMDTAVPRKHWHLSDPGVVPNLLQTGAGSPTGILVYEGNLLPPVFHNQMIHCDAGPNVVRSYPVTADGAGYKASVVNLVKGVNDNWFRPSDVCTAPDGSLFIADWYDPGVGGHQAGDTTRGRIYRLAPKGSKYKVSANDFSTAAGAAKALQNPNVSVRASAHHALSQMGEKAADELKKLWKSDNARYRARALWLLAHLPDGEKYLKQAQNDKDSDIRCLALRAARQTQSDPLSWIKDAAKDESPQVRREAALALHDISGEEAAEIWTRLALQYDGKDRWYLEALGIGSDNNAERCFKEWKKKVDKDWDTPAGHDIVWRVRSADALPLLTKLIEASPDAASSARYFRSLDFHRGPEKTKAVFSLLDGKRSDQAEINYMVLNALTPDEIRGSAKARRALDMQIKAWAGTERYLDLVERMKLKDQSRRLYEMAMSDPGGPLATRAAGLAREYGGLQPFRKALGSRNEEEVRAALQVIGPDGGWNKDVALMMRQVAENEALSMATRKMAMQFISRGWSGEDVAMEAIKSGKLPEELKIAAATQLLSAYREHVRVFAAEILNISGGPDLPPIAQLLTQSGSAPQGKEVFSRYCASCHLADGMGVNFGPSLAEIGDKLSKEGLYGAIINPGAGVSFGFEGYEVKLKDGRMLMGYVASRTDDEVLLRMAGGVTETLARADINSMTLMDQSLMTAGLHRAMSQQDLVNLVEYLSRLKKEDMLVAK